MNSIMMKRFVAGCVILALTSTVIWAESRHSIDFQYVFDGNSLPSDEGINPRWERYMAGGTINESFYCSSDGDVLTIDTLKGPSETESAMYVLPGEWSELANEFYPYQDPSNPWNPDLLLGYTVEIRFKMDPAIQIPVNPSGPSGRFGFWLYLCEGLHGQIASFQIFPDRIDITRGIGADETLYAGDLTDQFHTLRIVRHPGMDAVQNVYDLYLDGHLIAEKIASGVNAAWNQDDFYFGDAAGGSGGTDFKVEIDYLRIDLTGAYEPPYLVTDVNKDLVTDLEDLALLALNWMLHTDPDQAGYIDCTDPLNAERCE